MMATSMSTRPLLFLSLSRAQNHPQAIILLAKKALWFSMGTSTKCTAFIASGDILWPAVPLLSSLRLWAELQRLWRETFSLAWDLVGAPLHWRRTRPSKSLMSVKGVLLMHGCYDLYFLLLFAILFVGCVIIILNHFFIRKIKSANTHRV